MDAGLLPMGSSPFLPVSCLAANRSPNLTQILLLRSAGVCAWKHFTLLAPSCSPVLPFSPQRWLIARVPDVLVSTRVRADPPPPCTGTSRNPKLMMLLPLFPADSRLRLSGDLPPAGALPGVNGSRSPGSFPRRLFQQDASTVEIKTFPCLGCSP